MIAKLKSLLQRILRRAEAGHVLPFACAALGLTGTLTAAFPVTAVVVPATLLVRRRWRSIAVFSALGSALGATLLVLAFHQWGWEQLYEHFPEMASDPTWQKVIDWVTRYGAAALFLVAASPLPQTPALMFFGAARHDLVVVFVAMLLGKLIKYGAFAWASARFPERFRNGIDRRFWRRRPADKSG